MTAPDRGLFRKYKVTRTDGRDEPGERHYGCSYFVLDLSHADAATLAAIGSYADACQVDRPQLAADLRGLLGDSAAPAVPVIRIETSAAAQELVDLGWRNAAARALTDLADDWDREAAEERARSERDDVRCYSKGCNLRWAERQEYSCYQPGRAHIYDEEELAEASRVKIEPTYQGNEFRERAAEILAGTRHVLTDAQIKAEALRGAAALITAAKTDESAWDRTCDDFREAGWDGQPDEYEQMFWQAAFSYAATLLGGDRS